MTTIAAAVFDAIQATGRPCTRDEVCAMVGYENASVISAMHRLSDLGVLKARSIAGQGFVYDIAPGASRPDDHRGRPRKV